MTAQMQINVFLKASENGDSDDQEKMEKRKKSSKIQSRKNENMLTKDANIDMSGTQSILKGVLKDIIILTIINFKG